MIKPQFELVLFKADSKSQFHEINHSILDVVHFGCIHLIDGNVFGVSIHCIQLGFVGTTQFGHFQLR